METSSERASADAPEAEGTIASRVFDTPYGPQRLTYVVRDGDRIFEGDIVLPADEPEYRSGIAAALGNVWPNGLVPVESTGLFNDQRVVGAMAHWKARLPVTFVLGATTGPRLRFVRSTNSSVCSSALGRRPLGQDVNLGDDCDTGSTIHEIGHALGLWHEQSRTDRDQFVTINRQCIQAGMEFNFDTFGASGINVGPYDLDSIMHYGSTAFLDRSIPGCTATITRTDGSTFNSQRNGLTLLDVAGAQTLFLPWFLPRRAVDYDGDGKVDLAAWRASVGRWTIKESSTGAFKIHTLGAPGDVPIPMDVDGDSKPDVAVWRPTTGTWFVQGSLTPGYTSSWRYGQVGDMPVPGNYGGWGTDEPAVWRPSSGVWWNIWNTSTQQWGQPGDVPVPADYDGDGRADQAVWRPSEGNWYVIGTRTGDPWVGQWGGPGDIPVPADFDGDGTVDIAVWRPSEGRWYIINSSTGGVRTAYWGLAGDWPLPGDYTGDRRADLVVWRPSNASYYVVDSKTNTYTVTQIGAPGDVPVP